MNALPASIAHAYRLHVSPDAGRDDSPNAGNATRFGTGLINDTFRAQRGDETLIVQRVHPIFDASVHEDIEAVTGHLAARNMLTPRLIRTREDLLFTRDEDGRVWRALTFIEGTAHDRFPTATHVTEAGALVGRFHAALADFEHSYVFERKGVHDIDFREAGLRAALAAHECHRLHTDVLALARAAERLLGNAVRLGTQPSRHAHGDLKASNLLFRGTAGVALVDLDTMARMMWSFEMGDALRSWCNRAAEDDARAAIDLDVYEAALAGYGSTGPSVTEAERDALARGVLTISLELALRFLNDALAESYFGFDATRYPARGEHNLARARAQIALAESVESHLPALDRIAAATLRTA